jgi:hypothetical protein
VLRRIPLEKKVGWQLESVFHAQYIVRREKLIKIPAAFIKTGHLF